MRSLISAAVIIFPAGGMGTGWRVAAAPLFRPPIGGLRQKPGWAGFFAEKFRVRL